jgi:hypothetical protein
MDAQATKSRPRRPKTSAIIKELVRARVPFRIEPNGAIDVPGGAPTNAPADDLDRELADFEARHGEN